MTEMEKMLRRKWREAAIVLPVLSVGFIGLPTVAQAQEVDNEKPTLESIPTLTINEGESDDYQVEADDEDEEDILDFDLQGAPNFVSIDEFGLLSYSPGEDDGPKEYKFKVIVNDGIDSASRNVTLRVREVNQAPQIDDVPNSFEVDENELIDLDFRNFVEDEDTYPSNNGPQPQKLKFSANNLPKGAKLNENGEFSWTPSETQGGQTFTSTIKVSDGIASSSITITVFVEEDNQDPILETISDRVVQNTKTVSFKAKATDADVPKQTITYSLEGDMQALAPPSASINPTTGQFSFTPPASNNTQQYFFTIVATDSEGGTDSQEFLIIAEPKSNPKPSGKAFWTVSTFYTGGGVFVTYTLTNNTNITLRNVRATGKIQGFLGNANWEDGNFTANSNSFEWFGFDVEPGESESLTLFVVPRSFLGTTIVLGPVSVNFVADGVNKPNATNNIFSRGNNTGMPPGPVVIPTTF